MEEESKEPAAPAVAGGGGGGGRAAGGQRGARGFFEGLREELRNAAPPPAAPQPVEVVLFRGGKRRPPPPHGGPQVGTGLEAWISFFISRFYVCLFVPGLSGAAPASARGGGCGGTPLTVRGCSRKTPQYLHIKIPETCLLINQGSKTRKRYHNHPF